MRRYSLSTFLATALTFAASLVLATSGAQAGVVSDQNNGNTYGVTLVPGTSLASLRQIQMEAER